MKNCDFMSGLNFRSFFYKSRAVKFFIKFIIANIFCIFLHFPLYARDVNMDKIYLKKGAGYLSKIIDAKMEIYQTIGASLLEKGIIFADWTSGKRIVYIKENLKYNVNFLYEYYPESRVKKKIVTIKGAIIFARVSHNGRYFFVKRIIKKGNIIPENEIVIIDISKKKLVTLVSKNFFIDFTLSPSGESIFYENYQGLTEYFPRTSRKNKILSAVKYSKIRIKNNPVLAYYSPDRKRSLMLSGGGGEYRAYFYEKSKLLKRLSGLTSASEIFWLDNNQLVFRRGYPGFYRVTLYNLLSGKTHNLSGNSFNTNIEYNINTGQLVFLQDGLVTIYQHVNNKLEIFPLEGEDLKFSPDGNDFCILYDKRLYLVKKYSLYSEVIKMKRICKRIMIYYQAILKKRKEWNNKYTKNYLNRKISIYKKILK